MPHPPPPSPPLLASINLLHADAALLHASVTLLHHRRLQKLTLPPSNFVPPPSLQVRMFISNRYQSIDFHCLIHIIHPWWKTHKASISNFTVFTHNFKFRFPVSTHSFSFQTLIYSQRKR